MEMATVVSTGSWNPAPNGSSSSAQESSIFSAQSMQGPSTTLYCHFNSRATIQSMFEGL
jgi:hypothetical protein